ncbi:MAG TPA: oligosaccharide flippase family protein [Gemmatimonadales bacterium]|nr:oligosaccharide flippase family protein [Gemmatimonadales bacterium]
MTLAAEPRAGPSGSGAARPVARNAAALFLAYALPRGLTFLAAIVAARTLGTSDFGAYGTAGAFAVVLSIVATLGMIPLLVREFAQHPGRAPSLMRVAHWVKTASNAVMLAALIVLVRLLGYSGEVQGAALLLAIAYAIGAYGENLAAYFQATERMHVWTQASALYGLVTGLVGGVLVVTTSSLVLFSAAPILGQAAALGWLLARLPGPVRRGAPASWGDLRRLLHSLAPFAVSFVVLTVYAKLDVLLLAHWWPASEVGLYTAAYKFVDITRALATVGAAAVYPRLSRAGAAQGDDVRLAGARLLELALLVAVPVAALLWTLRAPVVGLAFGAAYTGSVPVLALLAAVLPALTANVVALYVLAAARAMRWVALLYGATLAINLGLNLWFIPVRGAEGAALAMLLSEWGLAVGALATARLVLGINLRPRALWSPPERAALARSLRRGPDLTPEIAALERADA